MEASTFLPILAPRRRSHPVSAGSRTAGRGRFWPSRAGVRVAHTLPADAAADRVVTGGQPDREKTNGHKGDDCEDEQTQDGRDGKHDQRLEHCARERVGVANPPTDQCDPGHQREDRHTGQEDRGDAVYRHPAGRALRMFGRPRMIRFPDLGGGGAGPLLVCLHSARTPQIRVRRRRRDRYARRAEASSVNRRRRRHRS